MPCPLLPDEQYDNLESHVEEYNLRVGVLGDKSLAFIEEIEDVDDVCLVDEPSKVFGEVFFLLRHVTQFWVSEVVHETFSEPRIILNSPSAKLTVPEPGVPSLSLLRRLQILEVA